MLLLGLLSVGVLATAVDAPVTSVTVYSDRARVVRTAQLTLSGSQRVELPMLRGTVDPSSVRVEAEGAEVARVDLKTVSAEALATDEARKVLDALDKLEDQLVRNRAEREACSAQLTALQGLRPAPVPEGTPDKLPPPRLDPSGWGAATTFLLESTSKLQACLRAQDRRAQELELERERLLQEAYRLGSAPRSPGLEVSPTLTGNGPVKLTLTYVTSNARWYPRYELQLVPDANRVQVSFFGLVSQESGEDWRDAALTLSTALPATATTLPRLTTWKIGQRDRFIPTPAPLTVTWRPPPPAPPPPPTAANESEQLRQRLLMRVQAAQAEQQANAAQADRSQTQDARGVIVGTLADALSRQPLPDVVVTVSSPALPTEQVVVTDASGNYRIPQLPPGSYTVRFEKGSFKPFVRSGIQLQAHRTLRVNMNLLPESISETIEIAGAPGVDEGSTPTGVNVDKDFVPRAPAQRAPAPSPQRSWEAPPAAAQTESMEQSVAESAPASTGSRFFQSVASTAVATVNVGLAPPPAYRRPAVDPRLPASLAGGYDLAFAAPRRETIPSGGGGRQVPLFTESWPVKAERKLFPALAQDAFLVAELQSPSRQVLPGGEASLFVGADPAGTASLKLVAPGERFTLPLGVDRAVRPVRNVTLVQSEKGFIGKDEETAYRVTIEVANPYGFPLPVRIHDQWPLTQDEDVEVKLVRTEPFARQDKVKGTLEWELTVPASGKTVVSFEYTLRHPKGWRLHQTQ